MKNCHIASKSPNDPPTENHPETNHTPINETPLTENNPAGYNSPIDDTTEVNPGMTPTSSKRNVSEILTPTSKDTPKFTVPRNIPITKKPKQDSTYTIEPELMQDIEYLISQEQTLLLKTRTALKTR
ncbi:hypothetical protein JTB14_036130 [Gonioctena quinquepunctata]|nr:hypothetical protein JTB14_036130 [Gonioctena quinquepunctata]